jgi:Putative rhamnosyl transferase
VFDHRPIVGHIRFSFYGVTDTRLRPDDDDAALARLYDETRMARRFHLFENLTLPSLLAQTDKDFRIVIMSSDVMPDRFKDRLRAVTAGLPDVVLDFSASRIGRRAFRSHMVDSLGFRSTGTAVHFRLDDDDALARTYIARLRRVSQALPATTHITFPSGIMLFPADPAKPDGVAMEHRHLLTGLGLAVVAGGTFTKNPFEMMHSNVWTRWPVVSDPSLCAYIRTQHFENDTVARQDKILTALRRERTSRRAARYIAHVDAALAENFPFIDQTRLNNLLAENHAVTSLADLPPVTA